MVESQRVLNIDTVRYLSIIIAFVAMLLSSTTLAKQVSGPEKQVTISSVSLATGTRYSPYIDSRLPDGGWSASVIRAIFKQLNIVISVEEFPWARVLESAKINLHDGAFPFVSTKSRQNDFYYSEPINYVPIRILANKNVNATSVEALKNYSFCLPYGYSSASDFLTVLTPENTTHAPTTRDCLNKVVNGWADIVLVNQYSRILHEKAFSQLKMLPIFVQQEALYFIVAKSHPQGKNLIAAFNQGLNAIKQNHVFDEINKQYELLLNTKPLQ